MGNNYYGWWCVGNVPYELFAFLIYFRFQLSNKLIQRRFGQHIQQAVGQALAFWVAGDA